MRKRDLVALAVAGVLVTGGSLTASLGASAAPAPDPEPSPSVTPAPEPGEEPQESGERTVDDAVFAWSISQQSNAQSHNPLTSNYLSAGAANPGRGGMVLPKSRWSARDANLEIQKVNAAGEWKRATWDGLGTDAKGKPIGLYGPFSGHRVRITEGRGTLNPAQNDADLQWRGTFTVVYYGGNTVFTLSDPRLTVEDGVGRLTATGGGWAADRLDPTVWQAVEPSKVPVAELRDVDVTETGLEVTPAYRGVSVTGPEPQSRTGTDWGSFPQEFVAFLEPMGASQFWYSTGLQSDWTKLPDPIAVGWQGAEPDSPKPTTPAPTEKPKNPIKTAPPKPTGKPDPTSDPVRSQAPVPSRAGIGAVPPALLPAPGTTPVDSTPQTALAAVGSPVQVTAALADDDIRLASASSVSTGWVVGGVLLLGAVLLLIVPTAPRRPRTIRP